jgi:hypothetical protein
MNNSCSAKARNALGALVAAMLLPGCTGAEDASEGAPSPSVSSSQRLGDGAGAEAREPESGDCWKAGADWRQVEPHAPRSIAFDGDTKAGPMQQ